MRVALENGAGNIHLIAVASRLGAPDGRYVQLPQVTDFQPADGPFA
jgi:hypothetical protein